MGQELADPIIGRAATGYMNFSYRPLFASSGPTADDIRQGQVGDCYFLSVLSSVAEVDPWTIRQTVADLGDGTYAVHFRRGGRDTFIRVDADLPTNAWGGLAYSNFGREGSLWVAVVEKAYAFLRTGAGSYASLDQGWMDESYNALGLAHRSTWSFSSGEALLELLERELKAGKSVTYAAGSPREDASLIGYHAYMVEEVMRNDSGAPVAVRLRNPWGTDGVGWDGINDGYVTLTAKQAHASMLGVAVGTV